MLFAMLFNGNDELIAAAPAVFQYAVGDSYWRDSYAIELAIDADCQTAYIEVTDDETIDLLNSLELDDQQLSVCRQRVNQLSGLPVTSSNKRPRAA